MTTTELPPTSYAATPKAHPSGDQLADNQRVNETQPIVVVGTQLPPTNVATVARREPSGETNFTSSQCRRDTHKNSAAGESNLPDSQDWHATQRDRAVGDQATRDDQKSLVAHRNSVVSGSTSPDSHSGSAAQTSVAVRGPILADPVLGLMADAVSDLEMVRVANENRLRTLTADDEFGHGLSLENKQVAKLAAIVEALQNAEHQAILGLQRSMREHPLGPFVKSQAGVGEKQAARLLAVIRDPYWNDLHDRPRTVSELQSYCGLGDAKQQIRRRGQKSNWSDDARKRVWLISAQCIKEPGTSWPDGPAPTWPYRILYEAARDKYADSVHPAECVRCGPKGKPAQAGSPLSLGHQKARAMRLMSKAILKDLWLEAKRLHEES